TPGDRSIRALYEVARAGSEAARVILADRASTLGRTVALLRDLFNPDRVVLGGQAFTEYPEGITYVVRALERASSFPRKNVHITGFGNRVQAYAAGAVSLSSLYSDPLGVMRAVAA
ncbi:MAG: ROK family protein, partial [Rhodococcus sp.]|nr:ROK family protein [Rhodococcus sp. (in: high G+C Gram-positive bacteria)]